MTEPIRVLVADDHTIVRSGVRLLLEAERDIHVVGEASDGRLAVELAAETQPNVVLMDIAMPVLDGLKATKEIKDNWPYINVLVLTMHRSEDYFFEMLKAGASGYILKGAETDDLIQAVRVVGRGDVFLYPSMASKLVSNYLNKPKDEDETGTLLSPRESEIMRLLVEGFSNNEIAERLVLSPSTIHTHRSNMMHKLGLGTRRELIQYARQHGLIRDLE